VEMNRWDWLVPIESIRGDSKKKEGKCLE